MRYEAGSRRSAPNPGQLAWQNAGYFRNAPIATAKDDNVHDAIVGKPASASIGNLLGLHSDRLLGWYVYRLVDPRNGETFYVGKGQENRIFHHAKMALKAEADENAKDLKLSRIKEILQANLDVILIIHRHKIENESFAYQIESCLIDAYPGLSNQINGHGSSYYGVRHINEVIEEYKSDIFHPLEHILLINISKGYESDDDAIYQAVRGCWKIDQIKAGRFKLVLAHRRGLVVGAFRPSKWLPFSKQDIPWLEGLEGRYGFEGVPADKATQSLYVGKRVPDQYRAKGAANPIRFIQPPAEENVDDLVSEKQSPQHARWSTGPEGITRIAKIIRTTDFLTEEEKRDNEIAAKGLADARREITDTKGQD